MVGSLRNVNCNLMFFERCPYDNDFWPISLEYLKIVLGAWNVFFWKLLRKLWSACFLKLRFPKIRLLVSWLKCLSLNEEHKVNILRASMWKRFSLIQTRFSQRKTKSRLKCFLRKFFNVPLFRSLFNLQSLYVLIKTLSNWNRHLLMQK